MATASERIRAARESARWIAWVEEAHRFGVDPAPHAFNADTLRDAVLDAARGSLLRLRVAQ